MGIHITIGQVSLVLAVLCTAARAQQHSAELPPEHSVTPQGGRSGSGTRCGQGRYWSAALGRCAECTHCAGPGREVTLRPCEAHRDARCGSVADLHIDWAWLRAQRGDRPKAGDEALDVHERINSLSEAEALLRDELRHLPAAQRQHDKLVDFGDDYILPDHSRQNPQPAPHKKEKKHRKIKKAHHHHVKGKSKPFGDYDDFGDFGASGEAAVGDSQSDDEDLALASWRRAHRHRTSTPPASSPASTATPSSATKATTPVSLVEDFIVVKDSERVEDVADVTEPRPADDVAVATTRTFSTAETLVWDWQAGVLVAAVCACLLFFLVAAAHSCQHAWHFKKLKKHLDADMEEISARLALMSGMGSEHLSDPDASAGGAGSGKAEFSLRRGDIWRSARHQNEYCLATLPGKSRV